LNASKGESIDSASVDWFNETFAQSQCANNSGQLDQMLNDINRDPYVNQFGFQELTILSEDEWDSFESPRADACPNGVETPLTTTTTTSVYTSTSPLEATSTTIANLITTTILPIETSSNSAQQSTTTSGQQQQQEKVKWEQWSWLAYDHNVTTTPSIADFDQILYTTSACNQSLIGQFESSAIVEPLVNGFDYTSTQISMDTWYTHWTN
jgi:hypothetical protein